MTLSLDQVLAVLDYNPSTGVFLWRRNGKRAGWLGERGYRRITLSGHSYYEHRLAWLLTHGEWPCDDIDHINGNRADNRATNLRTATRQQNLQNSIAKGGSSQFKGVHFNKARGKWQAYINVDGAHKYLGAFDLEIDAARAYDDAAVANFGPFAKINLRRAA